MPTRSRISKVLACVVSSWAVWLGVHSLAYGGTAERHFLFYALGNTNPAIVDGNLNDTIWKKSETLALSDRFNAKTPPRYPATFQLALAGNELYLAVHSEDPDWRQQKVLEQNRDQASWRDDGIEFFICPDADGTKGVFYQFSPNLNGVLYDSKCEGVRTDLSFQSRIEIKTLLKAGCWDMELGLPLDDLGICVKPGMVWRFNIVRNKVSGPADNAETLQWSPTKQAGNHDIPMFGYVVFTEPVGFVEYFNGKAVERCETEFTRVLSAAGDKVSHEKDRSKVTGGPGGELNWEVRFPENEHGQDSSALFVKQAAGADIAGSAWCEIKYRNMYPSNTLEVAYSYEGVDGKTYEDHFTLPHAKILRRYSIVDFNITRDGANAKKAGKVWAAPGKMKTLAITMKTAKGSGAGNCSVQIGYIRMTNLTLSDAGIR